MFNKGFCKVHGPERIQAPDAPKDLIFCSEVILSNLIYRILQQFRNSYSQNDNEIQPFLELLNELTMLGTPLRRICVYYLLNEEFYSRKIKTEKSGSSSSFKHNEKMFINSFIIDQKIPIEYQNEICNPEYKNILNEFLFWCVFYEFPQNLVKFLLNLFVDHEYKAEFTRAFLSHYLSISTKSIRKNEILNVSLISVQLFSNESITIKALNKYCLLPILLSTIYNVINQPGLLIPSIFSKDLNKPHLCVDLNNSLIHQCLYWTPTVDLIQSLTHKTIAISFLKNFKIFTTWLQLLGYFQAININQRKLDDHVEYELLTYQTSFQTELEFCSPIIWSFLPHFIKNDENTLLILNSLELIEIVLFKWLDLIELNDLKHKLTFHLPLHRFYSIFLFNCLFIQNVKLSNLLVYDDYNLIKLLAFPLQAQIGCFEIKSNLWLRNGQEMQEQVMMYIQYYLNDPDIFLLQLVLSKFKDNDLLMKILLDRFNLNTFFTNESKSTLEMLKSFFVFIAQLICIEPNLFTESRNSSRLEIISILCVDDRSFSEIKECLPDYSKIKKSKCDIEDIINEISIFKQPTFELNSKDLKQGYYVPKDFIWFNEYNPLHLLLRSVGSHGRFEKSFERFCDFVKTKNLIKTNIWPPFRMPKYEKNTTDYDLMILKLNILKTKCLHTFIFQLLYRHFCEENLPDEVFSLIIYILELFIYGVRNITYEKILIVFNLFIF